MYLPYCAYHGWSRPSVLRIAAIDSGVGVRPARNVAGSAAGSV